MNFVKKTICKYSITEDEFFLEPKSRGDNTLTLTLTLSGLCKLFFFFFLPDLHEVKRSWCGRMDHQCTVVCKTVNLEKDINIFSKYKIIIRKHFCINAPDFLCDFI
jgi:hypothetical protein